MKFYSYLKIERAGNILNGFIETADILKSGLTGHRQHE